MPYDEALLDAIEIRDARPDEYAAAGEVAVESYRDFYGEMLGDYEHTLRDVATRALSASILVAVDDIEIVGTVTYVRDTSSPFARQRSTDEASIRMLAVAPKHKRLGIGSALSVACIERARAEGMRAVVLHADEIMLASRALYEKLGFRRDPSRDYAPDEETQLLAYVLDL